VSSDVFTVVADPTRRRILHELIDRELSVGELVGSLGLAQPTVSKHLKVLRDNGFVASRTAAQHRIYRLDRPPFVELEAWLGPFRRKWNRHLDALEQHLDAIEKLDHLEDKDD
jgi:DNA-binding transcriptional ArsR family regulator